MAVPKKNRSKSKSRIKKAAWQLKPLNLRPCPDCGEMSHPHRACIICGYYKGQRVLAIKSKSPKTKE